MERNLREYFRSVKIKSLNALMAAFLTGGLLWPGIGRAQDLPATLITISPGVYRLGSVTLDKAARQVRFPAAVNQTTGPVEYLLVGSQGKVHESVLRTDVEPMQVHTAMLLLGIESLFDKTAAAKPLPPPAAIDADYLATAPLPAGAPVTLLVRWRVAAGGPEVKRRAESLIDDGGAKGPMSDGFWLYNGSMVVEGRFQAAAEKSFAAVITDPTALINNPRPGHADETLWTAATDRLPPAGSAVEFIIQLPAPKP